MKTQSILSAFPIMLGSSVLHLTLFLLACHVKWPSEEELIAGESILAEGEYECVSASELEASIEFCKKFHLAAAIILFYLSQHTRIWLPFAICSSERSVKSVKNDAQVADEFNREDSEDQSALPLDESGIKMLREYVKTILRRMGRIANGSDLNLINDNKSQTLKYQMSEVQQEKEKNDKNLGRINSDEPEDTVSLQQKLPSEAGFLGKTLNSIEESAAGNAIGAVVTLQEQQQKRKDEKIEDLLDEIKEENFCMLIAKIKPHSWIVFMIPLLLIYLVIVYKASQITQLCRKTAQNLTELEQSISIFVFFEMETFAFFGIIFGLWLWITFKYILNCLYQDGPRHSFKTEAVKHA